jgi:hypothetical protein
VLLFESCQKHFLVRIKDHNFYFTELLRPNTASGSYSNLSKDNMTTTTMAMGDNSDDGDSVMGNDVTGYDDDDDDGDSATGDGATGDSVTGYDDNDDGNG